MTRIWLDVAQKIRRLPLNPSLETILESAAESVGVDEIRVTSAGQDPNGIKGITRKGSTRHDNGNAADLQLIRGGRTLLFTKAADLPVFEQFVFTCVKQGAVGVGAGVDYMGPHTIHIGFGSAAYWGRLGSSANAPSWLRRAFQAGMNARRNPEAPVPPPQPLPNDGTPRECIVTARSGLNMRSGPGTHYPVVAVLSPGTRLLATQDPNAPQWAKVDIHFDGLDDGFVHASYVAPA